MKLKRSLLVVLALVVGFAMVGCGGEKPEATADGDGDGEADGAVVEFVNVRCPIMGSPIDAANVPASLVREHKGRKVALCCAGCPEAWDALSDEEKDAKLAAVTE